MRHACSGRKLNRTPAHRRALYRNLVQSLIEHGEIRTTIPKAKEARKLAERLITLGIDGSLAARQRAIALLNDRAIIARDHQSDYDHLSDAKRDKVLRARSGRRYRASTTRPGVKFTAQSVIHKLFDEIGPRMKRRANTHGAGGYTRIIKLAQRRLGDGGQLAILQLVGEDDKPRKRITEQTERRRRAKVKYAFYAGKPLKRRKPARSSKKAEKVEQAHEAPSEQPPAADGDA